MKIDRVVVATAVSWLGLWAHELHRVPRLLGFTPDGDLFMLPIAAGFAFWWSRSRGARAAWALAICSAVNLAGAVVTVLPLGFSLLSRTRAWPTTPPTSSTRCANSHCLPWQSGSSSIDETESTCRGGTSLPADSSRKRRREMVYVPARHGPAPCVRRFRTLVATNIAAH